MASPIVVLGFGQQSTAGIVTGANLAKYVDTVNGTAGTQYSIVADAAFGSGFAFEINGSAAAAFVGFFNNGNGGLLGSSGTLVGSFKFRFPTLPSADFDIMRVIGTAGGNDAILKYLNSTTGLQAVLGANTNLGPTIDTSVHQVDFRVVLNSGSQTFEWSLDGTAQTTVNLTATTQNLFKAGFGSDNGTQNGTMRVSDVVLSLTSADYPLGSHKVILLKPDTGGTTTQLGTANATARFTSNSTVATTHNSADILAAISEVPPLIGATATGVAQRTSGATNAVEIPMTTYTLAAGESFTGLRLMVCGWASSTTANNLSIRTWNGSTETQLMTSLTDPNFDNNTTTPQWYCKQAVTADFDTQTEVNAFAVRFGYSTDVSPTPGAHAIYAEVAVKESTGVTASPGGIASGEAFGSVAAIIPITAAPSGIASAEIFGSVVNNSQLVSQPGGVATAEAFGTPVAVKTLVSQPAGVASAEAFGLVVAVIPRTVSPGGIASAEQFGSVAAILLLTATPTGIGSLEGFGTPTAVGSTNPSPTGIASAEAFGTPLAIRPVTSVPNGIASAEGFGAVAANLLLTATPSGIGSGEAFGNHNAVLVLTASPSGVASGEAFGTPVAVKTLTAIAVAIASAETFGAVSAIIPRTVSPTGIASAETFGAVIVVLGNSAAPSGIPSAEAFGTPVKIQSIFASPTGVGSLEAFGTPLATVASLVSPAGIATAEQFGVPSHLGSLLAAPVGIPSLESFGVPNRISVLTASPVSIVSSEAFGVPVFVAGGVIIQPIGILSAEQFGNVVVIVGERLTSFGDRRTQARQTSDTRSGVAGRNGRIVVLGNGRTSVVK